MPPPAGSSSSSTTTTRRLRSHNSADPVAASSVARSEAGVRKVKKPIIKPVEALKALESAATASAGSPAVVSRCLGSKSGKQPAREPSPGPDSADLCLICFEAIKSPSGTASIKELRELLRKSGASSTGCNSKRDFLQRLNACNVSMPRCGHVFHADCLRSLVASEHRASHVSCPMCRNPVEKEALEGILPQQRGTSRCCQLCNGTQESERIGLAEHTLLVAPGCGHRCHAKCLEKAVASGGDYSCRLCSQKSSHAAVQQTLEAYNRNAADLRERQNSFPGALIAQAFMDVLMNSEMSRSGIAMNRLPGFGPIGLGGSSSRSRPSAGAQLSAMSPVAAGPRIAPEALSLGSFELEMPGLPLSTLLGQEVRGPGDTVHSITVSVPSDFLHGLGPHLPSRSSQ